MTGENSDDLMRMSSSDESPKELEEVTKDPTNVKDKRKEKKIKLKVMHIMLNVFIAIKRYHMHLVMELMP
ncbi:hypothetical protein GQ457_09G020160 [Hibiscus cannabinus]